MQSGGTHIFTLGHSNRTLEELLSLLSAHGIEAVADVRRYPSSRRLPHFNRKHLQASLEDKGIRYQWFEALGGRRDGRKDTPNTGIDDEAFRNYADHMLTGMFKEAVAELIRLAKRTPTAVMCAEKRHAVCHRNYLSDFLHFQDVKVEHLLDDREVGTHQVNPLARLTEKGELIYPSPLFS